MEPKKIRPSYYRLLILKVFFILFSLLSYSKFVSATDFYVSTAGLDPMPCVGIGNCSIGSPCATVQCGIDNASSGDTVNVAAGTYTISSTLHFNSKDITVTGAGVQGSNLTLLEGNPGVVLFNFNGTETNAAILQKFVLHSPGSDTLLVQGSSAPTIQQNIILPEGNNGINSISSGNTLYQNNIVSLANLGIASQAGESVINNTVLGAGNVAFFQGDRANNIAFFNNLGFSDCTGGSSADHNTSSRNTTNYQSCPGNLNVDPHFIPNIIDFSTTVGASTLVKTGATWVVNQWQGYFVTPNIDRSPYPIFFYILSNTADTLTVASTSMSSYGSSGYLFMITEFAIGTTSPAANSGTTSLPNGNTIYTTDVYGNSRTGAGSYVNLGAVAVQATSGPHSTPSTLYVATTGTDSGECTNSGSPCLTLNYALANSFSGDTLSVAAGTYNLIPPTLNPLNRNLVFQGTGVQGSNMTLLQGAGGTPLFTFNTSETNATLLKNFALHANGSDALSISGGSSPTIEQNIILPEGNNGINSSSSGSALYQNNIVSFANFGIASQAGESVINNTVLGAGNYAFYQGDRANNIAFFNNVGFSDCTGPNSADHNTSSRNTTNYQTCPGNLTADPHFIPNVIDYSTTVGASTLVKTGAGWAVNQWKGYFVTPNIDRYAYPIFFYILSNTSDTLTVASSSMSSYGSSGYLFMITEFGIGTTSPAANSGTTSLPNGNTIYTTDVYGDPRTGAGSYVNLGAVAVQATSGPHSTPATLYVATTGTDSGECTNSASPCLTLNYALANSFSGDTISVAAGTYNLLPPILNPLNRELVFQGSGVQGSNMTLLNGVSGLPLFAFNTSETNATILKNFVLHSNTSDALLVQASSSPTIEQNIILPEANNGINSTSSGSALYQNNIVSFANFGIASQAGESVINNTVLGAGNYAFFQGDRNNNLAYLNNVGFSDCSGGNDCSNNDAYGNSGANYQASSGTSGLTVDPSLSNDETGNSTTVTGNTLVNTGAGWTTNQWKGFFVTPNTGRAPYPFYFYIISNTSDTLTVASSSMSSYGSSGNPFAITSFTPSSTSAILHQGLLAGAPPVDVYGNLRPYPSDSTGVDIGAVEYSPEPTMSINDVTVAAGTTATFTVTLSNSYGQTVTVHYATANNTAIAGTDYTNTSGDLTFNPGTTTQTINVPTTSKTTYGPSKTFFVNLTSPVNATITDSQGIGTITNPNSPPSVTLNSSASSFSENGGTVLVTATLSALSEVNTTVNLSFGGTAVLNTNYTTTSNSIVITAGSSTGSVTLTGVNDGKYHNPDLTVIPSISSVINGTAGSPSSVNLTLTNTNTAPTVSLSVNPSSISQNGGTAIVTATLSAVSGSDTTVNFSFGGTATASTNYTTSASSIFISAGSSSGTLTITRVANSGSSDLTVIPTISSVINGTAGTPDSVTITLPGNGGGGEVTINVIGGNTITVGAAGANVTLDSSTTLSNPAYSWAITSTTTGNIAEAGFLTDANSAVAIYHIPANPVSQTVTITLTVTGTSASIGARFNPNSKLFAATSTATATTQIQINGVETFGTAGGGCSLSPNLPTLKNFMINQLGIVLLPILIFFQIRRMKKKM